MSDIPQKRKHNSSQSDPATVAKSVKTTIAAAYQYENENYQRDFWSALGSPSSSSSPSRPSSSTVPPPPQPLHERDGITVIGEGRSVGTLIKEYAFESIKEYEKLGYERKAAVINGINSILDLSDSSTNGQKQLLASHWQDLKERFPQKICVEDLPTDVVTNFDELAKKSKANIKMAYSNARRMEGRAADDDEGLYASYAHVLKVFKTKKNPLNRLRSMTEYDHIIKLWSPIFEGLFQNEDIELLWGESVMKPADIDQDDPSGPEERVFFKVDLRLTLEHGDKKKTYDLAVVEFARFFEDSKIRQDHSKLLVESKIIVDSMIGMACPCDEIVVPCLQICGLHGDFSSLELAADGLYIAKSVQTFCLPSGIHRLSQMKKLLACLVAFKAQVMRNKDVLESYLNDSHNDPYGKTFGRQEGEKAKESCNWRRISWWPGNRKSSKEPSKKRVFGKTS